MKSHDAKYGYRPKTVYCRDISRSESLVSKQKETPQEQNFKYGIFVPVKNGVQYFRIII